MAVVDTFPNTVDSLESPASSAFAITPHDTNDLTYTTRGIYIGTSGDVKVDMADTGTAITFVGMAAGVVHPLRVTRVYDTDTDADDIVGLY